MKELLKEAIDIATLIANDLYLEIGYELEDDQVMFMCNGKQFKVEVNKIYYAFIDIDAFEFVCTREVMIEKEFFQLFTYHINYWLREIRRHEVAYVLYKN